MWREHTIRESSTYLIKKTGFTIASGAKSGAVMLIQRFGSALNLNIHFHMLFLDGVYSFNEPRPKFHRAPPPNPDELSKLLHTITHRVVRAASVGARIAASKAASQTENSGNKPLATNAPKTIASGSPSSPWLSVIGTGVCR